MQQPRCWEDHTACSDVCLCASMQRAAVHCTVWAFRLVNWFTGGALARGCCNNLRLQLWLLGEACRLFMMG